MPGYKGHIAGALIGNAAYVGGVKLLANDTLTRAGITLEDWQLLVGLFVVAVLFGLWPYIDTNSKGQNIFFGIAFIADILLIVTGRFEAAAYLGLLAMTPIIGKHRGWTHSKVAMLVVPLPILLVPYLYSQNLLPLAAIIYGAAVLGYFSHLLLDGLIVRAIHFKGSRE
jgi:hypothetical protein